MSLSLAALADLAEEEGRSTVDLFAPRVRFHSVGLSDLDACLDWFAELIMTVDIDDADDVIVGSLDFTLIRLGTEDPIALCLDQFDGDHEMLADLFDGNQLAEQVEEQYETLAVITEAVLVPNIAFVTEPLRGHDLGAWLVSETIHRMLPTGIVLMWPYPVLSSDPDLDAGAQIAALDSAISRLSDHFGRCGLTPIESAPWALGMSTAFEALPVARSRLGAVRSTTVSLSIDQLRAASPPPALDE
ncbi:hypothetical protein SIM91_05180 [Rhodococcus opacus]|uniref:hypothetical protein n=1 Tax=Rhodococcus opacus TaxID=37919 RepID=UPI0002A2C41A|nr:hypothetical protein [Rhodococcus opacus]ELB90802.1 hypothetical protein Rwratislav_22622 [Rhodococcus wratislaviensis IFP 2016]MDX5962716.1 hypothetical protein [Rhodococcus opacus]CAG7636763.1 hypothetical protein E143388_07827 [Rhodococcus opacus]